MITSAQFREMEQRVARHVEKENGAKVYPSLQAGVKESELHEQILAECARRRWIVFHGSMAHRTFRTPGEPDFVILANQGFQCVECGMRCADHNLSDCCKATDFFKSSSRQHRWISVERTFLIEAKAAGRKLSPDQQAIAQWAAMLGHTVHVVRSFEEFLKVVA